MVLSAVAEWLWLGPGLRQVALVWIFAGLWTHVCPWVWQYPFTVGGGRPLLDGCWNVGLMDVGAGLEAAFSRRSTVFWRWLCAARRAVSVSLVVKVVLAAWLWYPAVLVVAARSLLAIVKNTLRLASVFSCFGFLVVGSFF